MKELLCQRYFSLLLIFYVTNLSGQTYYSSKISLSSHSAPIKLKCVPFDKVIVLDNRIDTSSRIYTYETGQYPLAYLSLNRSVKNEIESYIYKVVEPLQKGNYTLLVNIEELHIPNYGTAKTNDDSKPKSNHRIKNTRDYVNL